jgi:serine/threonine protein kinase
MRATHDRLDERFIVPIARELAEGLRAIHEAGIIHRDVKGELSICRFIITMYTEMTTVMAVEVKDELADKYGLSAANVLIHEEGRLQICDFGVAGVLQSQIDKRSTWIGTPHWMPPEMFPNRSDEIPKYGSEVSRCLVKEIARV